jgi:hypothetical protein
MQLLKFNKFLSQAIALIIMDNGRVVLMQGIALIFGYAVLKLGQHPINLTIMMILNLLISIAVIYRLYAIKHGLRPSLFDCMRISFERGPSVILAMFMLMSLGLLVVIPIFTVVASPNLTGDLEVAKRILYVLYVVMAAILLLGGCFLKILIIVEKFSPMASLKQSFKLAFRTMPKIILIWIALIYCFPYITLFIFNNLLVHALSSLWLLMCSAFLIVVYDFLDNKN